MRGYRSRELSRLSRAQTVPPEIEKIFQLIYQEKLKELSSYILNEQNEIWNIKRGDNVTILHSACVFDNYKIVKIIVELTKKRLKLTPESSISNEEKEKNEKIFKNFINSKTQTEHLTPLHYASFRGNLKVMKLLISNHADINALSLNGLNMLHKAAQGNKPSAIIFYNKKYNIDLNSSDNDNLNALHLATISGMDSSVIYLLSLGMDPNAQDINGNTPLHYAVKYNQIRIIKKLLQNGAKKNIINKTQKKTPVMMAEDKPEILEIFRKKGICEKLFFKPDISKKTAFSNINMILFITLHLIIMFLTFFMLMPYFNNTVFAICYLTISFLVFCFYGYLSFSDPGVMTNNEFNNLLDAVEKGENLENFCPFCLIRKNYKNTHCLICQKCIDEFDHHCFWVGNCIGKNNYTFFFIFLIFVIFNTIYNFGITSYYIVYEMTAIRGEIGNNAFPGFYFGVNSFIYNRVVRIGVSICISVICVLFFIPLIDLFQVQLSTALEKRQIRLEEEEYEKSQLQEKLIDEEEKEKNKKKEKMDEEIWDDFQFDDE
jgi:ankyrin repeat protein